MEELVKEFLDAYEVESTEELLNNSMLNEAVQYINLEKIDTDYINLEENWSETITIDSEKLIRFLNTIKDAKVCAKLLEDAENAFVINDKPELIAEYFNIYSNITGTFPGYVVAEFLVSNEYTQLCDATWTDKYLLNPVKEYVLTRKEDGTLGVQENLDIEDDEYMPSFALNVRFMKELSTEELKQAVELLTRN